MPSINPVATSVTTDGHSTTIHFNDGHRAVFESFNDIMNRKTEGLMHFWLFKRSRIVVQYHGQIKTRQRHIGPSDNEHRFVQVTKGYTREHIVGYWKAAVNFVEDTYVDDIIVVPIEKMPLPPYPVYSAYDITQASVQDLSYIEDKLVPLPGEQ